MEATMKASFTGRNRKQFPRVDFVSLLWYIDFPIDFMKVKLSFIFLLLLFPLKSFPDASGETSDPIIFTFSEFYFNTLPGAYFYPTFFENFAPDTTLLIEENNGFALIDSPRVYFEGDSYTDFNWYSDGYGINSVLKSGAPAILLPISSIIRYELRGESPFHRDYGMNFVSTRPEKTFLRIWASNVWPHMGGLAPGATSFVSPHPTSDERNRFLYSERRQILSNYLVDLSLGTNFKNSAISLSLTYFDIERQFNDFSAFDTTFSENGNLFLVKTDYQIEIRDGSFGVTAAYNSHSRDAVSAELGRLPQETLEREKQAFFSGLHFKKNRFNLRFSFCQENEDSTPSQLNFLKDLKDNDGEGFYPFTTWGSLSGSVFRLRLDNGFVFKQFVGTELKLFADFKHTTIRGDERAHEYNPISFDRSPYLVLIWQKGLEYRNKNIHSNAGALFQTSLAENFDLYTKFVIQYSALRFTQTENNLSSLDFGYDIGLLFEKNDTRLILAYERMPYEIREDVNFFLERQRPWGTYLFWDDINQDLAYEEGEEGEVFGHTGGQYHSLDEEIKTPYKKRLLLGFSTPLSQKFTLNIKGLLKNISNNYWIKFKDEYGFYETVGEQRLYFFSQPFKDYVLSNDDFNERPYYLQFLLQISGQEERRWLFSFSFMAHIGMGYTPFGNGPGANDFGILDESQANPNTWINGYGRVDGDRAFVGKLYLGFYLAKNLLLGMNLKYRDGTPFAFIGSTYAYDQWAFYLETIQAENKKGIKGGPRRDYLTDISLKLSYNFRLFDWDVSLFGSMFNLLDFGSELSEYVFSGGKRYSNEIQIPRSARAGIKIEF
jgi:hypothetical protein